MFENQCIHLIIEGISDKLFYFNEKLFIFNLYFFSVKLFINFWFVGSLLSLCLKEIIGYVQIARRRVFCMIL